MFKMTGPKCHKIVIKDSFSTSVCYSNEKDTWLQIFLKCNNSVIHGLIVKIYNKAIWEIQKLLLSIPNTRCYILMNARTFMNSLPKNIVPLWLLQCTWNIQQHYCNVHFKPYILCVQSILHIRHPPLHLAPHIKIQFIEFTYTKDRVA